MILHLKLLWVQIRAVFYKQSRANGRFGDQGESISLYEVKYLVLAFKDLNIFQSMALNYYLPSDLQLSSPCSKKVWSCSRLKQPCVSPVSLFFALFFVSFIGLSFYTSLLALSPQTCHMGFMPTFKDITSTRTSSVEIVSIKVTLQDFQANSFIRH